MRRWASGVALGGVAGAPLGDRDARESSVLAKTCLDRSDPVASAARTSRARPTDRPTDKDLHWFVEAGSRGDR